MLWLYDRGCAGGLGVEGDVVDPCEGGSSGAIATQGLCSSRGEARFSSSSAVRKPPSSGCRTPGGVPMRGVYGFQGHGSEGRKEGLSYCQA